MCRPNSAWSLLLCRRLQQAVFLVRPTAKQRAVLRMCSSAPSACCKDLSIRNSPGGLEYALSRDDYSQWHARICQSETLPLGFEYALSREFTLACIVQDINRSCILSRVQRLLESWCLTFATHRIAPKTPVLTKRVSKTEGSEMPLSCGLVSLAAVGGSNAQQDPLMLE